MRATKLRTAQLRTTSMQISRVGFGARAIGGGATIVTAADLILGDEDVAEIASAENM